jgi:hypothetical protein
MCARVCVNWHKISRHLAFWGVELKTEEEARRFLAALNSNEAFAERNPGWPRINSTRSLVLGNVNGLFLISLIYIVGDTAAQILRMLPKLKVLRRDDSPMSFDELSIVSKNLVKLLCSKGFDFLDFDNTQIDMSLLVFPHLEKVFIVNVLKNSIPQGRGFLKSLVLCHSSSDQPTTNSSVDYSQLIPSLIKVIEVRFHTLTEKASPGMSVLQLILNKMPETVNLDSCLDIIFKLDQIASLCLIWNQMSLHKIKSSLKKQGGMKRWEKSILAQFDQEMNDTDILEICSYLPSLREWTVYSPGSTITIDIAREWKKICPDLAIVRFVGGGLSEEVNELLEGLGVTVKN